MTIDTNKLRQLAQEAMHPVTKGRWIRLFGERTVYDRMEDGCRGTPVVSTDKHPPSLFEAACLDFVAAANPAAITELLDQLEAAEKERDWYAERCEDAMNEIKALRAKIEQMEKQEPVGTLHDDGYFVWRKTAPYESNYGGWKMALYALPGAKGE